MKFFGRLLDIFFPEDFTCDICGREVFGGERFCKTCKPTVIFNDGETCPVCGRKTRVSELCMECKSFAPSFDKAVSAFVYDGGVKKLVVGYKNGKSYLKEYFADRLYEKCKAFTDIDCVCYIPMLPAAQRKRGYNQAQLLAAALSKRLGVPLLKDGLVKTKKTDQQKFLTKKERLLNLTGSMRADANLVKGKTILLVDDVLTTGATAEAATVELKRRGAVKVYFAAVASVELKGQP